MNPLEISDGVWYWIVLAIAAVIFFGGMGYGMWLNKKEGKHD